MPYHCSACGGETQVCVSDNNTKTLYCMNESCEAKNVSKIVHFASKKGMDIDGFSEATIE